MSFAGVGVGGWGAGVGGVGVWGFGGGVGVGVWGFGGLEAQGVLLVWGASLNADLEELSTQRPREALC